MNPIARVGDLAEQVRGVSYEKSEASSRAQSGYVPVLRAGNITDDGLRFDDLVFVPARCVSDKQRIRRHDVVIATSSGSLDVVGKAAAAVADYEGSFGAFCRLLRPNGHVDPRYFAHYFKTEEYRTRVSRLAAGANINNLRTRHLDDLLVPLFTMEYQRRTADLLDRAEALRAKRRAALALLDTLMRSIFVDLFGDPTVNPRNWPMSTLGEHSDVQGGLQVSSARSAYPTDIAYLRVANVYRGFLVLDEIKTMKATDAEIARTLLMRDDLLIVEGHGNPSEIGRVGMWDGSIERCVHQNHLIRVRLTEDLEPRYACEYLNSPGGRRHLLRSGKSTSGLNTISVSEVRATPIAIPPQSVQEKFIRRVAAVERLKAAHRASLARLDELFASLQHRAFRGEL